MFDYQSISPSVTEEAGKTRVTALVQFSSAAALSVAVDLGILQGMSMTWEYWSSICKSCKQRKEED